MNVHDRARTHAALGDPHRLRIVDELLGSDRTFQELATLVGLPGNAAAHHLAVLEGAGLIERHISEGDHRRRYVSIRPQALDDLVARSPAPPSAVLFICTHNSARSQFAAALWSLRTSLAAESAGRDPAPVVHPAAVSHAADYGVDLSTAVPKGYDAIVRAPDLLVSVCDRAREADLPFAVPVIHWSIPDPVAVGSADAFRSAFAAIAERVDRFASSRRLD